MDITHLVVNGCSWTYCQGLDDPKTQGWPALVAKELGIPVVNIAVPGSGNDSICRRTHEYVYKNLPTESKPFFIIFWSQYWRREAWYEDGDYGKLREYRGVTPPWRKDKVQKFDEYSTALMSNWNEEDFLRKTLLNKLSTMNLFKVHDIPYVMTDFGGKEVNLPMIGLDMKREIDNDRYNFTMDLETEVAINNYPKLPCGHDGVEAQKETAKWLLRSINPLFNEILLQSGSFLSLEEFGLLNTLAMKDNTSWK